MQRSESTPVVRSTARRRPPAVRALREAACLVLSLAVCSTATAQSNPRQLADANKSAMEQYNNLDIDAAKAGLEKAVKNAEKNGIRGPALARTYSNLAVVLIGGNGDQKGATTMFSKALAEDPNVEPDPIVATPEVMQAFNAAKKSAPKQSIEEDEPAPPPRKKSSAPAEGNLDHTPVAEQLTQTAVPVFVAKSDLDIDKIKIAYRSTGMQKPRSASMTETDDGYTFLIPCTDVFEPEVEYFIVAVDSDGNEVGRFGAADAPVSVPIVSSRTQDAPSLPGENPPTQCTSADNECPPGMPGCEEHGNAGLGEACSSDSDCGQGMVCEDDFCSLGEREHEEASSSSHSKGGKKRFYLDVGIGVALTAVGKGRAADRNITKDRLTSAATSARGADGTIDQKKAAANLAASGWDCDPHVSTNAAQQEVLTVQKCSVAVNPGGIVPVPVINFAAGMFVTPSFALALAGRFQIGHGEGPLAGITIGARGEYYLTKPKDTGFKLGLLAGLSLGQMQARPPAKGSQQGPYATNANVDGLGVIINVGARAAYMIAPGFGLNVTPIMNFGAPNFLYALDLTAGVSAAF